MGWGRKESCIIVCTESVNTLEKKGGQTIFLFYNDAYLYQAVPTLETEIKEAVSRIPFLFFFLILFSYRGDDQRDNTWWISVGRVYYWQPAGSCWPSLQPFAVTLSLTDDQRAKADLLHEFLHEHHHWQSWVIREWERVRRIIWFQFLLWQCFCLCGLKWIT